jgi:hypothetical protein
MQALMIYTSKCYNLNILRYDVLFILRLINIFIHIHNTALSGPPVSRPLKQISVATFMI